MAVDVEFESNGARLHVDALGDVDAPPLLLMHGVLSSGETWDWLPPRITEGRRILNLDHRGHGRSGHHRGTYVLKDFVDDAIALIEQVIGRPTTIVGHSLGGNVGWAIAQQRPELLVSVFSEDPPVYYADPAVSESSSVPTVVANLVEMADGWNKQGLDEAAAIAAYGDLQSGRGELRLRDVLCPDEIASQTQGLRVTDREVAARVIDNGIFGKVDAASPINDVPTLIVAAGDAYGFFPSDHARRLKETHPNVPVVRFNDAGHAIHGEFSSRKAYTDLLAGFLDEYAR